jgi:hypothetical protein
VDIDATQLPSPLGPVTSTTYRRTSEPIRPDRRGARNLTTNRVVGEPTAGLTVIRTCRTAVNAAEAGDAADAADAGAHGPVTAASSTIADSTTFRSTAPSLRRDRDANARYI